MNPNDNKNARSPQNLVGNPSDMRASLLLVALGVAAAAGLAQACSPYSWGPNACVFASHMVLASNDPWSGGVSPARVWGTGFPGEKLLLQGLPAGAVVEPSNPWLVDALGNWSITVSVPASLTAYNLTFIGAKLSVVLEDVLFGHTFLCSGQSNMDMIVGCTFSVNQTNLMALDYPEIRLMNQGATGNWYSAANPTSSAGIDNFSATCYYTALHLKLSVPAFKDVPLGLVRSSVGGQCIERFMTPAAMESVGVPAINATDSSCGQSSHTLYDTLIAPLVPFVFKTMVWYQGEANVDCNADASPPWIKGYYAGLLPELVTSWRTVFDVPFTALVVQLAPFFNTDSEPAQRNNDPWPVLRDAQNSVLSLPGTAVAVINDLGDDGKSRYTPNSCVWHGWIHPRNKTEVGRRLALKLAELEGVLPAGVLATGPVPDSFASTADGVSIAYATVTSPGLALTPTADCTSVGRPPKPYANGTSNPFCCQLSVGPWVWGYPFELRLADNKTYVLANATVHAASNTISLVPFAKAEGPFTAVRYAWQGYPMCVVSNQFGLPGSQFIKEL